MSSASHVQPFPAPPVTRIVPQQGWFNFSLAELWHYRELLYFFVWRDIKIRYKQTAVGVAWAVLQPLLTMLVFSLFFGRLAHIPSDGLPYSVFYYSALLPWAYFASGLQNATSAIVENQRVVTKVYFPRLVLPVSGTLSGLVDFAVSFVMFAVIAAWNRIVPTMAIVYLPLFLLLAILTALGFGLWLAALNAIYRDVRYVLPFLVQFWMFASPVAYPSSLVPEKWRWMYGLNPIAGVIEGFRWALTGHGNPPGPIVFASSAVVLVVLVTGLSFFARMETTIADVV